MAQILVRNLNKAIVDRLKARAMQHNRSLQNEVKTILEQAAQVDVKTARELAMSIRKHFAGRAFSDSVDLIREDRDR